MYHIGRAHDGRQIVFVDTAEEVTEYTHGDIFTVVTGPFETLTGALWAIEYPRSWTTPADADVAANGYIPPSQRAALEALSHA